MLFDTACLGGDRKIEIDRERESLNRFHSACVREREGDLDSVLSERMCLQCLEKSKRQTESHSIPTLPVRFETGPCYLIIWPI